MWFSLSLDLLPLDLDLRSCLRLFLLRLVRSLRLSGIGKSKLLHDGIYGIYGCESEDERLMVKVRSGDPSRPIPVSAAELPE